jgi:hypothetical protein
MRTTTARARRAGLFAAVGTAAAVFLAACGGAGATQSAATAAPAAATTVPASTTAPGGTAGTITKVSANTATQSELVAALTAAGVPNADRWAREVMEYRPYAADDPTLQHLQDNLAKYNPDPATLAGILAALQP